MDAEKIKEEGVQLLDEFSKVLEDVGESKETHYVTDIKNVWRKDGMPDDTTGFQEKLKGLAPNFKDGYVVCEKVV